MKVIAFIPVKGSSSRIENKNINLLDGKPLFIHTLEKLLACEFIHEVYIDTESEQIINLCSEYDCKIHRRDPALATNSTDGNELFYNEIKNYNADIFIQVLCTSPFIQIQTIKNAVSAVCAGGHDSAVLVRREKLYQWKDNRPVYNIEKIPNSNDLEDIIYETMGLYVTNNSAKQTKRRIGCKPQLLFASATEAIDVNYQEDFDLAQLVASGKREQERKLFNNIKTHLTSSILSDIMDELKLPGVLQDFNLNLDDIKIFGRAKTLEIRELECGEDYRGIYDALKTYNNIIPGDIIFVKNNIKSRAYFGELNANLAIRCGSVGAIIDGFTRDTSEVKKLRFPVFSKGNTCVDVKGVGTVKSCNKTIEVGSVKVHPEDLVFGDRDGVVVIPKVHEERILDMALKTVATEKNILIDICDNIDIDSIVCKHGFF